MEIGIIGHGVVGGALHAGFERLDIVQGFTIYDPVTHPVRPSFKNASFVFICVPTPSYALDVAQDVSAVVEALDMLAEQEYVGIVVLKSTTTPTNTSRLVLKYNQLHIIANPEFLTERCAGADFEAQPFIIIGGKEADAMRLASFYRRHWIDSDIRWLPSAMAAMMVKYMLNCFYATKVTVLNEYFHLWNKIGDTPWEHVIAGFRLDTRVSSCHTDVPGPDGKFGFGGKCFPKDLKALVHEAHEARVPHNVLTGALRTNNVVRNMDTKI